MNISSHQGRPGLRLWKEKELGNCLQARALPPPPPSTACFGRDCLFQGGRTVAGVGNIILWFQAKRKMVNRHSAHCTFCHTTRAAGGVRARLLFWGTCAGSFALHCCTFLEALFHFAFTPPRIKPACLCTRCALPSLPTCLPGQAVPLLSHAWWPLGGGTLAWGPTLPALLDTSSGDSLLEKGVGFYSPDRLATIISSPAGTCCLPHCSTPACLHTFPLLPATLSLTPSLPCKLARLG